MATQAIVRTERLSSDTGFLVSTFSGNSAFEMPFHAHGEHELNVVTTGMGTYRFADGSTISAGTGSILFLPACSVHRLEIPETYHYRGLLIHPKLLHTVANVEASALGKHYVVVAPDVYQNLLEIHGQAQANESHRDVYYRQVIRHLAGLVGLYLMRLDEALSMGLEPRDHRARAILVVKAWLDRHYAEAITVPDMASMANLSPSQFGVAFARVVGIPPKHYLIQRRFEQAAMLLVQSGLSIIEVAYGVGFQNVAPFNRGFKSFHGCTPGEFRRKHQDNRRKE